MRVIAIAVLAAGCASASRAGVRARPVALEPGVYRFDRALHDPQSMTTMSVALTLATDGRARAVLSDSFVFVAEVDGELERDDRTLVELAGRWWGDGDGEVDVRLGLVRACAQGFGEAPCAEAYPYAVEPWHLACARYLPAPGSALVAPALICRRLDAELPPKYATRLDGAERLVLFGP